MAEKALLSMAQQFSGLPMDSLIGGPLNAAAKANSAMAMTQTKFMLDTCFQNTGDDKQSKLSPIMIDMTLTRGVLTPTTDKDGNQATDIQQVETNFRLPLITIVPLNSLGVDNVDITFEMEVKSSYGEEESQSSSTKVSAEASWEVKMGWGPVSATVTGKASYDKQDTSSFNSHYEKSNSAKYTVNVHAGQLPLPKGVNTIIEAYASSIQPVEMPANSDGKAPAGG